VKQGASFALGVAQWNSGWREHNPITRFDFLFHPPLHSIADYAGLRCGAHIPSISRHVFPPHHSLFLAPSPSSSTSLPLLALHTVGMSTHASPRPLDASTLLQLLDATRRPETTSGCEAGATAAGTWQAWHYYDAVPVPATVRSVASTCSRERVPVHVRDPRRQDVLEAMRHRPPVITAHPQHALLMLNFPDPLVASPVFAECGDVACGTHRLRNPAARARFQRMVCSSVRRIYSQAPHQLNYASIGAGGFLSPSSLSCELSGCSSDRTCAIGGEQG